MTDYPRFKLVINRMANCVIRVLFRHGYNDTTNAFKAYRREVIETVQPLLSNHFNLTVELPLKAIVRGHTFAVCPVSWTNRRAGASKLSMQRDGQPVPVHRAVRLARAPPEQGGLPLGSALRRRMSERRVLCRVGWVLVGLLLIGSIRAFVHMVQSHSIVDEYIGPLYFVDYSDGFIRRGLVGEVVDLVAGHGQTSTEVAGWTLTLLGTFAAIAIVLQAAWRCRDSASRCLVATLGILTPLGITTILRDPGRYDAIGLVFIALLLWATRRQPEPGRRRAGVRRSSSRRSSPRRSS